MKCEKARKQLDASLEPKASLFFRAPALALHLAFCKDCRQESLMLKQALKTLGSVVQARKVVIPGQVEQAVMEIIEREQPLPRSGAQSPVSFRDWIVVGLILFIALCTLPFSSESSLVLILTVSIFLTLYGSLLIGTHLDELAHHFGLR